MPFFSTLYTFFTYFLIKITQNELFLIDSQFREMAYFFLISIWGIPITYSKNFWGQTLLKLLKLLGPPHKYKRVHDIIVWPLVFLKYAHKLQGGMHLATQDAHLLNCFRRKERLLDFLIIAFTVAIQISLSWVVNIVTLESFWANREVKTAN
jgi:hypothetical protein